MCVYFFVKFAFCSLCLDFRHIVCVLSGVNENSIKCKRSCLLFERQHKFGSNHLVNHKKKLRPKQAKNENNNDAEGHKMDATVVKCNSTVTINVKVPSDFVDECNKTGRLIMICWKVHDCCIAQFVSHSLAKNTFFEDTRIL